ncbi:MAG: HAD hydrolase-like protein [Bdellovibrionales bacterium]|nr:HAD hydrolase-like protein [Bdellovibrionales bacterium]
MKPLYEHIVFDLDDTLLDTSGTLVPIAVRRACLAMIDAGLPMTIDTALQRRNELRRRNPRLDAWTELEQAAPEPHRARIAEVGSGAFYRYNIDELPASAFRPQEGALELLQFASRCSKLHLVSAGDEQTQRKKIERLAIGKFFASIHLVAPGPGHKHGAFAKIAENFRTSPGERFVSVGNRVDTDLGEAKTLGWNTVWIRAGEHVSILPQASHEIPDFEAGSPMVLLRLWEQQFPAVKDPNV